MIGELLRLLLYWTCQLRDHHRWHLRHGDLLMLDPEFRVDLLKSVLHLGEAVAHVDERVHDGVGKLLMVKVNRRHSCPLDDLGGHAHDRRVRRNGLDDDRSSSAPHLVPHRYGPEDCSTSSYDDVVADGRVALLLLCGHSPQGASLVDGHVVPDLRRLTSDP